MESLKFGGKAYFLDFKELARFIDLKSKPVEEITATNRYVAMESNEIDEEGNIVLNKEGNPITYIDNEELSLVETLEEVRQYPGPKEFDPTKFEVLNHLLEIILTYKMNDEEDSMLGVQKILKNTPIGFKIAFNTLIKYNILKEEE